MRFRLPVTPSLLAVTGGQPKWNYFGLAVWIIAPDLLQDYVREGVLVELFRMSAKPSLRMPLGQGFGYSKGSVLF